MNIQQMPKVIDISRWQGLVNWSMVGRSVHAAMIKVGGSDVGFYMDGYAHRNLIEARSNGLPIGTYYYLGGVHSVSEEVQHIVSLYNQLGGLRSGEPMALDWEERRAGLDEVGYLVGVVEGLTRRGFPPPLIYMNLNYVRTQNWQSLVQRGCKLWVAAWGNNNSVAESHEVPPSDEWPNWTLWQYSSTGNVPGINGRVDYNLLNGDISVFKQLGVKGQVSLPGTPLPVSVPIPPAGAFTMYKIQAGDTLSAIAARYGRSWQELYAINRDLVTSPNRIYTGRQLRVWSGNVPGKAVNPQLPTRAPVPAAGRFHIVENGENLSVIAARYAVGSWRQIYDLNRALIGDNPNLIKPGQRLRIP